MYQNSGNILFISDKQGELKRIRHAFVESYNVFTAASIREGHTILREYDIHVVLVKQQLPEMSGLQFFESISPDFPDIIKIILNNTDDDRPLEKAYETGKIDRFVQVPFSNMDLQMIIDSALKLHNVAIKNRELSEQLNKYKTDREDILHLFKRYVPGEVVSRALETKQEDIMKPGESRIVSVLFVDMRDFSSLSAQLQPSETVQFLNDYWNIISDCVKNNKGSVNKYMGDGLLAVFGAPVSYIDNHENAVSAALDIIDSLDKINAKYSDRLGEEIKIGIGINSGEVVVGNVGTENLMEYTVIGNTVNIASRLEAISKKKPNSIMISKETRDLISHEFDTSELYEAEIADKKETLYYCEVLGRSSGNIFPMPSSKEIS